MSLSTLTYNAYFQFLGISVHIQADEITVHALEYLQFDFQNFKSEMPVGKADIFVRLVPKLQPNFFLLPFMMNSDCAAFGWWSKRMVHYSNGSGFYRQKKSEQIEIQVKGNQEQHIRQAAFHVIISAVGELLEKQGYLRLHAAALKNRSSQAGVLLFGLSGSGKSTLILQALEEKQIEILGDDLIFCKGDRLYSFPLHIFASQQEFQALNLAPGPIFGESSAQESIYKIPQHKIAESCQLGSIAYLKTDSYQWMTSELSLFEYVTFVLSIIFGIHLAQKWEYVCRLDNFAFAIRLFFSRLILSLKLLKYSLNDFRTGPDPKLNYQILKNSLLGLEK